MSNIFTDAIQRTKNYLGFRKQAYQQVFNKESQHVLTVMSDLTRFCRGNETAFHADPRIHAVLEGRREVYLRIVNHLNLSSEELFKLYGRTDLDDNR